MDIQGIQRDKNETLFIMVVFYFLAGVGIHLIGEKSSIYEFYTYVCSAFNLIFTLRWITLDARQHNYTIPLIQILLLVIFTTIGAIVYFFKTRERQQALRSVLRATSFFFLCLVSAVFGVISALLVAPGA